jgi:hypothetical protein
MVDLVSSQVFQVLWSTSRGTIDLKHKSATKPVSRLCDIADCVCSGVSVAVTVSMWHNFLKILKSLVEFISIILKGRAKENWCSLQKEE